MNHRRLDGVAGGDLPATSGWLATLAEVAAALDVDTSTASETIRRGTARVVEWFRQDAQG